MNRRDTKMDSIYANIELANPKNGSLKSMAVKALVDTGAMTLCIPEHIATQLQLQEIDKREVTTADERRHVVPYVGPVQISFENRTCFTGALVL
ncbi:MAG TPA: clan AA aspartic protease, partial [Blastocatellia bacterium]